MDKVVVTAALTGVRATRDQCPAIPYTPKEIAEEAKRAADAGAAIVHIHARTPEGGPDWRVETFAEIFAEVRARTDVIVNFSTAPVEKLTITSVRARTSAKISANVSTRQSGPPSGVRAWMWTIAAPASAARPASSPNSLGVYGMAGHWSRVASTPVSAAVTTTFIRGCFRACATDGRPSCRAPAPGR